MSGPWAEWDEQGRKLRSGAYLVGSKDRIKDRLQAWRESPVTSILVSARSADQLRQFAELVLD